MKLKPNQNTPEILGSVQDQTMIWSIFEHLDLFFFFFLTAKTVVKKNFFPVGPVTVPGGGCTKQRVLGCGHLWEPEEEPKLC